MSQRVLIASTLFSNLIPCHSFIEVNPMAKKGLTTVRLNLSWSMAIRDSILSAEDIYFGVSELARAGIEETRFGQFIRQQVAVKISTFLACTRILNCFFGQFGMEARTVADFCHEDDVGNLDEKDKVKKEFLKGSGVTIKSREWTNAEKIAIRRIYEPATELASQQAEDHSEVLLAQYCEAQVAKWKKVLDGEDDTLRLVRYVSPSFSLLLRGDAQDQSEDALHNRDDRYRLLCQTRLDMTSKFSALFDLGNRILVHEDAGSGKSVFTRAAVAWLSGDASRDSLSFLKGERKRCLAMRWEREHNAWPAPASADAATAYFDAIVSRFKREVSCEKEQAEQVVRQLWKEGRIVLFLDAFDQLSGQERLKQRDGLVYLANNCDLASNDVGPRIVVTSRAQSAWSESLFRNPAWRTVRIHGFSPWQQLEFLIETLEQSLDEATKRTFNNLASIAEHPDRSELDHALDKFAEETLATDAFFGGLYSQIRDMLAIPVVLQFIQGLASSARSSTSGLVQRRFPRFANRAELYWQAIQHQFEENLRKAQRAEVNRNWEIYSPRFGRILAAAAFHMMDDDSQHYATRKMEWLHNVTYESVKQDPLIDREWTTLWGEVKEIAGLTNHLLIEEKSERRFGFKHKGIMEFYCAMYIANFASATEQARLFKHAANPAWWWTFRFAMELTQFGDSSERQLTYDASILTRSLASLFGKVEQKDVVGKLCWRRPTQLMYYAYCLLRSKEALGAEDRHVPEWSHCGVLAKVPNNILEEFSASFDELIARNEKFALQLVPSDNRIVRDHSHEGRSKGGTKKPESIPFAKLPRQGHATKFHLSDSSNKSICWKQISLFQIMSSRVSQGQFRLFDPAYLSAGFEDQEYWWKGESYPAIYTNYYDAFMFCRWTGGHLPTESQWSLASRSNVLDKLPRVFIFTVGAEKRNRKETQGRLELSYPRRSDEPQSTKDPWSGLKIRPISYSPTSNLSGNSIRDSDDVYEWCGDWYIQNELVLYEKSKEQEPAIDPLGPGAGIPQEKLQGRLARVLRKRHPMLSISESILPERHFGAPEFRGYNCAFRIARAPKQVMCT